MQNLLKYIFSAVFLFSITFVYGKGREGDYFIKGKLYNKESKAILINTQLIINGQIVVTDSNGNYEYKVHWVAVEKHLPFWISRKQEKLHNPKWIVVEYKGKKIRIKNTWKKFAKGPYADKDSITLTKDLYM